MLYHRGFDCANRLRVAIEQTQLIKLRAHCPFQSPHCIASDHAVKGVKGIQRLFGEHCNATAQCAQLRSDIVSARGDPDRPILRCPQAEQVQHGHRLFPNHQQAAVDLELLHILRQVTTGHSLVNVLVSGQPAEFFYPRLHVMTRRSLALHDRGHVHRILYLFISRNRFLRNLKPGTALRPHHGDPEFPLQHDFPFCRPDLLDVRGSVTFGEDIWNRHAVSRANEALRSSTRMQ